RAAAVVASPPQEIADDSQQADGHNAQAHSQDNLVVGSGFLGGAFILLILVVFVTPAHGLALGRPGVFVFAATLSRLRIFIFIRTRAGVLDHEAILALRAIDLAADQLRVPDRYHRLAARTLLFETRGRRHDLSLRHPGRGSLDVRGLFEEKTSV